MIALLLFLISIVVIFIFLINCNTTRPPAPNYNNLPPGSFGWPYVGESLAMLRTHRAGDVETFIRERLERYGSPLVFKTSLLGDKMAVLVGPAGNKFLFANENKLVASWWPKSVKDLLGNCLTNASGDEAKRLRKILLSYVGPEAFSRNNYTTTMDMVTRLHIQNHWQGKNQVHVFKTLKLHTFELACRLFMSLEDPKRIEKLASLFNVFLKGIISIPLNFPGTNFYSAMKATAAIRTELGNLLKERRVALEEGKASSSQDLLSHLLVSPDENGKFLTQTEIVNNILLLLFAGHDTSTVTISLVMKTLGELPQVYEKVLREQLDIAEAKAAGELLRWEDIQKMRYSWNVVLEVMRITPPIFGAYREALVDFNYAGYTIPKGWKLYWNAAVTHRDENYFQNVKNFDASRFEGTGPPIPFSYVPFGGGPRMCVGKEFARLEILTFLHNIVTSFRWDLLIPDEKITYDPMPVPVNGLPVRLHPHGL